MVVEMKDEHNFNDGVDCGLCGRRLVTWPGQCIAVLIILYRATVIITPTMMMAIAISRPMATTPCRTRPDIIIITIIRSHQMAILMSAFMVAQNIGLLCGGGVVAKLHIYHHLR